MTAKIRDRQKGYFKFRFTRLDKYFWTHKRRGPESRIVKVGSFLLTDYDHNFYERFSKCPSIRYLRVYDLFCCTFRAILEEPKESEQNQYQFRHQGAIRHFRRISGSPKSLQRIQKLSKNRYHQLRQMILQIIKS